MTVISYDLDSTMRAARERYFAVNGFGDDGGYGSAWVDFKLGPVPFPFPNSKERVRALRFHDLHHILTGYDTNFLGELEISAWEIGAGCKDYTVAWLLNLSGIASWWLSPGRIFRAWVRGRRSRSLYGEDLEPLLDGTVRDARATMRVPASDAAIEPALADRALFVGAALVGTVIATALFAVVLPLVPVGLVSAALRRRAAA
jgi:hypothetical protein